MGKEEGEDVWRVAGRVQFNGTCAIVRPTQPNRRVIGNTLSTHHRRGEIQTMKVVAELSAAQSPGGWWIPSAAKTTQGTDIYSLRPCPLSPIRPADRRDGHRGRCLEGEKARNPSAPVTPNAHIHLPKTFSQPFTAAHYQAATNKQRGVGRFQISVDAPETAGQ